MDRMSFHELFELVTPFIKRKDSFMRSSISADERLALTLRFLATGDSYKSLWYLYIIPTCTISSIIPETCEAIYTALRDKYLKVPDSQEEWLSIAKPYEERWNFLNCIGAMDGKHIANRCPSNSGSGYYNYKNFFSVILLAVVDADYKLVYIDVGSNGRNNDSGVFGKSNLYRLLESNVLNLPPPKPLLESNLDIHNCWR